MTRSKTFCRVTILVLLFVLLSSISAFASFRFPWDTPGYLVIGECYTNLTDASREYDQRKADGYPYVHIRNTRNWATSLQSGYYAVVYNACDTLEQAQNYAAKVQANGIDVYVKNSGRPVGEAGGKTGYHIIGLCTTDRAKAMNELYKYSGTKYVDVTVWKTDEFEGFRPGYYAIIYGVYKSEHEAERYADYIRSHGIDVYVKYGAWKG